jgi:beta-galactosidase
MPHWNWPDSIGKIIKVWVYSNGDEVELFLNGISLGKQKVKPLDHLVWDVVYQPGKLMAKASTNGLVMKKDSVETTGRAYAIKLFPDKATLLANSRDVAIVNFAIIDHLGRIVPEANNKVNFKISGAGKNIGVGNGDPIRLAADHSNQCKAFKGLGQLIIQAKNKTGKVFIKATSKGLRPAMVSLLSH